MCSDFLSQQYNCEFILRAFAKLVQDITVHFNLETVNMYLRTSYAKIPDCECSVVCSIISRYCYPGQYKPNHDSPVLVPH